jgi:transposase
MRAYSTDLRIHLLQAIDQGTPKAEAARIFGVSVRTIERYATQRRTTGDLRPAPIPGRPRKIGPAQEATLLAQVAAHPTATLRAHCAWWEQAQGVRVSEATMSRMLRRVGWTRKKGRWWPPSKTRPPGLPGGKR